MKTDNRKIILVLCGSAVIDSIGYGIIMPMLPFYAQSLDATPTLIGILIAVYPLMELFAPAIWGCFSDRVGRRKALLLNIAGTALSFLWFGLADSLWMLFIARALGGLAGGSSVIAQSYVADITTSENRASSLGLVEAANGIGLILGPAIVSFFASNQSDRLNLHLPGLTAAGLSLLTLYFAFIALPRFESRKLVNSVNWKPQKLVTALFEVLRQPVISRLIVIVYLVMFVIVAAQTTFALWCQYQFGWGLSNYSYLIIFCGVLGATVQIFLIKPLTYYLGEVKLMLGGLVSIGFGLLLIPFSTQLPLLLGTLSFVVCGQAVNSTTITSLISQFSQENQHGKTLGVTRSAVGLASFTGAIWGGFMFQNIGASWPYWGGAILVLGAIIFIKLSHLNKISKPESNW
jgi:MFS transporter, DHA1 family, tetracycline resistance protein